MKILCVTHSSRPFVEARSSLNGLEQRFGGGRDFILPPIESLPGIDEAVPFDGALTLWAIEEGAGTPALRFLWAYNPGYKIQSATFVGDRLVICGSDRLEVLNARKEVVQTIRDPWICGGHTVFADQEGTVWITSAPANAVMRVSLETGDVVERIRMPERYGKGYDLSPQDDLHKHFVPTDLQPTHVNCAYPVGGEIYVTLWIPGVVGRFDVQRQFHEIVSGIRGCHGGKLNQGGDELYVTDSPTGLIWFFDPQSGHVRGRLKVDSVWLHDSHYVSDEVIAVGLSDHNEIRLIDRRNGTTLVEQGCDRFGKSVMFVNCCEVTHDWVPAFSVTEEADRINEGGGDTTKVWGPNLLAALTQLSGWLKAVPRAGEFSGWGKFYKENAQNEYLLISDSIDLHGGEYAIEADVACRKGNIAVGLVTESEPVRFLGLSLLDAVTFSRREVFHIEGAHDVRVVISAHNGEAGGPVDFVLRHISLRQEISAVPVSGENEVGTLGADQGRDAIASDSLRALQQKVTELQCQLLIEKLEVNKRDDLLFFRGKPLNGPFRWLFRKLGR